MKTHLFPLIAFCLIEDYLSGLDIRLVDRPGISSLTYPVRGYVETLYNGYWSPICADSWGSTESQVLCRMLGYNTSYSYLLGSSTASIYNVTCTGNERLLDECTKGIFYQYRSYYDMAYVRCGTGNTTDRGIKQSGIGVRLVGSANLYEGRVEVFALNQWMVIYAPNDTWSYREASVVCRTLGFSNDGSKRIKMDFLNNVKCTGLEKSLDQCVYNTIDCNTKNFVYLQCGCITYGCSGSGNFCDIVRNTCVSSCSSGSYVSGSMCYPCAVGYYQPLQNQFYCNQCPSGTFQNRSGQSACTACPSGSYQSKPGQTSCDLCPNGTYQNQIGQNACIHCPTGTYQYWTGQTSCVACEMGTYQNSSGETTCIHCGKDFITHRYGSDSYSDCYDEYLDGKYGHMSQSQINLITIVGSLMIGIAFVNITLCIFVLKRMCLKSRTSSTKIAKSSSPVRKGSNVTGTTIDERYEVCGRH